MTKKVEEKVVVNTEEPKVAAQAEPKVNVDSVINDSRRIKFETV